PLASTAPAVVPGEFVDGNVPGTTQPIWHFQDDAVQGDIRYTPGALAPFDIVQLSPTPQNYVFVNSAGVGPIDGPPGIEQHSKDLAFQLYTTIPEPGTCLLLVCRAVGLSL